MCSCHHSFQTWRESTSADDFYAQMTTKKRQNDRTILPVRLRRVKTFTAFIIQADKPQCQRSNTFIN